MVDVALVVTAVSIAFMVGMVAVVSYFAFSGPSRGPTAADESDQSRTD